MPAIKQNGDEWCLDGYGDADKCYDSEEAAIAAVERIGGKTLTIGELEALGLKGSAGRSVIETQLWQDINDTAKQWTDNTLNTLHKIIADKAYDTAPRGVYLPHEVAAKAEPPPDEEDEPAPEEPEAEEETQEVATVTVPTGLRKLIVNLPGAAVDAVVKAFGRKEVDDSLLSGFKVFQQADGRYRWTAWYSNNFEDRDSEFFREKGFDRYVKRLDMALVDMPELWAWHTKGTRSGGADWVDRIGHFHVATGLYDETPAGKAAAQYDLKHYKDFGVSHGFLYRENDVEVIDGKKVFNDWNTFEISPLPLHRAANELTAFAVELSEGIKETTMDAEKRKHLAEKFAALGGEEYVARLEAATEKRGKEMEALRGFKDFVHPEDDGATAASKEAVATAEKAFGEYLPQLAEDAGEAVSASLAAVKAVTVLQADNTALRQEVAGLKALIEQRPRASQSNETLLDTESGAGKAFKAKIDEQMKQVDGFWGTEVVKTP